MATLKPRTGARLSIEEFLGLPDTFDKRKMELDEGELYIMPRPRMGHQFLQGELIWHFKGFLNGFDEPPADVFHDVIVALSLESRILYAPDLVVILEGSSTVVADRMVEGPPDIVVEILSSDRRRGLVRKRQVYAEAGVPEYWIFDPREDTATLLELRDGEYVERAVLTAEDTLTTPLLPGLAIPLADVFRHRRRPAWEGQ